MERIFDICHGCRRCVRLCGAFPDAVRPRRREQDDGGRRRRQAGLLEGRRPVLPVRPLLHDEVPVRSAASVERRLPAPDAARRRRTSSATATTTFRDRLLTGTDRLGKLATIPVVVQMVNKANRTPVARKVMRGDAGRRRRGGAAAVRREAASRSRRAVVAWPVRDGPAHAGQGRDLRDLLRQLQRAGHRPRPAQAARAQRDPVSVRRAGSVLRHAEARARRPRDASRS